MNYLDNNSFDSLILVDPQKDFFLEHPDVKKVEDEIKLRVINAIETNKPIFIITKRDFIDNKGVIIDDDTNEILDSIERIIEKNNFQNIYYLSKDNTSLFGKETKEIDIENVKELFKGINTPLISGCHTLACEFAVARDLIDNDIVNPKIDYYSSNDGFGSGDFDYINSIFNKYGYKDLLYKKELV